MSPAVSSLAAFLSPPLLDPSASLRIPRPSPAPPETDAGLFFRKFSPGFFVMFVLCARGLVSAFAALATFVFAQGHTSEQSEAQITGPPFTLSLCSRPLFPPSLTPVRQQCRRPDRRMHPVLLRAFGPVHSQLPDHMAARDAARERFCGPGDVEQDCG